jgi:hypothetical protein
MTYQIVLKDGGQHQHVDSTDIESLLVYYGLRTYITAEHFIFDSRRIGNSNGITVQVCHSA